MEQPNVSSLEQLEKIYADGKISDAEYETLREAIEEKESQRTREVFSESVTSTAVDSTLVNQLKTRPWQVWVAIGVLGLSSVGLLAGLGTKKPSVAVVGIILNLVIAFGLSRMHKWAFVLFEAFVVASLVALPFQPKIFVGACTNLVFGIILATAYQHFFPHKPSTDAQ